MRIPACHELRAESLSDPQRALHPSSACANCAPTRRVRIFTLAILNRLMARISLSVHSPSALSLYQPQGPAGCDQEQELRREMRILGIFVELLGLENSHTKTGMRALKSSS